MLYETELVSNHLELEYQEIENMIETFDCQRLLNPISHLKFMEIFVFSQNIDIF